MKRVHDRLGIKRQTEREARQERMEANRQRGHEMKAKERRLREAAAL